MANQNMITLRNKKTGEVVQVPQSQYVESNPTQGRAGIANDVLSSLASTPEALGNMMTSIPAGIKQAGRYALTTNPVSTLANIGAGGVESGAGLASSPQILMRYLAQKFPELGLALNMAGTATGRGSLSDPTIYEKLMSFEKNHGLGAQSPDEESVRNAGGLLFGGKLLSKLPSMLARTGTVAAQQAGQGGDPVHGALLALIGDATGKVLGKGINSAAGAGEAVPVPENMPSYYRGQNNDQFGQKIHPDLGSGYWMSPDKDYASQFGKNLETVKGKFNIYDLDKGADSDINNLYKKLFDTRNLTEEQQKQSGLDKFGSERVKLRNELRDLLKNKGYEGVIGKDYPGKEVLFFNKPKNSSPINPTGYQTIGNIPKAAYNIGKAIPDVVSKIPEIAGKTAASALESTADLASGIPVVGKAVSSVVQPTMGALASYLKHISVAPEELAKRNLFGDIDPSDIAGMVERDAAGKRLNLTYNTPSELMDSPFESVKQANVGRTTEGMKLLYKLGKQREASEGSAINKLFDLIHEDKLDPIKKAAYEQTMQNTVPNDFVEKHAARPVIQKAMKAVENNTAYKQMLQEEYGVEPENIAKNSFMYWDMVKRVLGDMEQKLSRKGSNTEASVYGNTRRTMVSDMDEIEPQYKVARNIAERKFTRDELEHVFDKKDKTFNNFYSFLKSKENYERILDKLDAFPEAKQQLEDIKLFSGNMIPNNPTVRAAAALKRTGMSDARNAIEAKKREYDERYGQEHDVAAVKQMTHPDLMKHLMEYLNQKGRK